MRPQLQGNQRSDETLGDQRWIPDTHRAEKPSQRIVVRARQEEPMSIDRDNPKWTAYVLGELDARERAALESELESSEEAREFVEELRLAASMMKDRLAVHAETILTPEQQFSIQAASSASQAKPAVKRWSGRALAWTGGLAAAALVIAAISIPS